MKTYASIAIVGLVCWAGCCLSARAGEVDLDWIKSRLVTKTTEKADHAADGALEQVNIRRELKLNVHQVDRETRSPDEQGRLRTTSRRRTTTAVDTQGGKLVVEENLADVSGELRIVRVTENRATGTGTETVIKERRRSDRLEVVKRITVEHEDGVKITTVESPGPDGELVITSITTER